MKILIVIDYFQPKLGYSEFYLAQEFKHRHHDVKILTSDRYFPFPEYEHTVQSILGPRLAGNGQFTEYGIDVIRQPVIIEKFCRTIFFGHEGVISNFHPDIVLVNGIASYHAIRLAQLKEKYKYRLLLADSHLPSEYFRNLGLLKKGAYSLFRKCFADYISAKSDRFVAVQEDTRRIVQDVYGISRAVDLIDLGVDTDLFKFSKTAREKHRSSLGIGNREVVAIYTGKLIPAKGINLLFKAFQRIGKKAVKLHLVLVGQGSPTYLESIQQGVLDRTRVHLVGLQPQAKLPGWYSAADFAVWPLQETVAMNEAAACGLPFIANNEIGARLRVSGDNAILYKKGSLHDLENAMLQLYGSAQLRKKLGFNGRVLAKSKLSWHQIAARYIES